MGFRCQRYSCQGKYWREFREHFDQHAYSEVRVEHSGDDVADGEEVQTHERKPNLAYRIKELFQLPPVSWQVDKHRPAQFSVLHLRSLWCRQEFLRG